MQRFDVFHSVTSQHVLHPVVVVVYDLLLRLEEELIVEVVDQQVDDEPLKAEVHHLLDAVEPRATSRAVGVDERRALGILVDVPNLVGIREQHSWNVHDYSSSSGSFDFDRNGFSIRTTSSSLYNHVVPRSTRLEVYMRAACELSSSFDIFRNKQPL